MNSGDVFADNNVLSDVAGSLSGDIAYGNVIRILPDKEVREKYSGRAYIKWLLLQGKMICHQAMFIKTAVMREYGYNLEYKITADFNMLCRLVHDKKQFAYIDRDIVRMDNITGISTVSSNLPVMWKEDDRSIRKYFPVWYYLLVPIKKVARGRKSR